MRTPIQIYLVEEEGRRHDGTYSVTPGTTISELLQSRCSSIPHRYFTIRLNNERPNAQARLRWGDHVLFDLNSYDWLGQQQLEPYLPGTHVALNGAGNWSYADEVKRGQYLEGTVVDINTDNPYWPVVLWNHGREERFQLSKLRLNLPMLVVGNELRLV